MSLARPLEAGMDTVFWIYVASATIENFNRRSRDEEMLMVIPALRGWAKLNRRYASPAPFSTFDAKPLFSTNWRAFGEGLRRFVSVCEF
jgi:hypothetical protein